MRNVIIHASKYRLEWAVINFECVIMKFTGLKSERIKMGVELKYGGLKNEK